LESAGFFGKSSFLAAVDFVDFLSFFFGEETGDGLGELLAEVLFLELEVDLLFFTVVLVVFLGEGLEEAFLFLGDLSLLVELFRGLVLADLEEVDLALAFFTFPFALIRYDALTFNRIPLSTARFKACLMYRL